MTITTSFTKKYRFPRFEETLFDLKDDGELSQNSQKVFKSNKKQTKMEKNSTLSFFVDVFKGARDNATFVKGLSTSGFQYLFLNIFFNTV